MNVCCTLAFWFSLLSDSSDTNNRQAKAKPTGRPKPPAAKEQNFGSGSDRLSVICQKRCEEWSCGDKQATVCLVSVKVRHRIVWHKNKNRSMWISSHSTSLCFQLVFLILCVFRRGLFWHLVGWEGDGLSLQHHGEPDVLGQYCQLPGPGTHVSVHALVRYLHNQSICFIRNHFLKSCWLITHKLRTNTTYSCNNYQKHR